MKVINSWLVIMFPFVCFSLDKPKLPNELKKELVPDYSMELNNITRQMVANEKSHCSDCDRVNKEWKYFDLWMKGFYDEPYNPIKVTSETWGAKKNKYGQWSIKEDSVLMKFVDEGYMIDPKRPNVLLPNPNTKKGRALIEEQRAFKVLYSRSSSPKRIIKKEKKSVDMDYNYKLEY